MFNKTLKVVCILWWRQNSRNSRNRKWEFNVNVGIIHYTRQQLRTKQRKEETVQQTMWPQQRFTITVGQAHKVSFRARGLKTILTANSEGSRAVPSCLCCFLGHPRQPRVETRGAFSIWKQRDWPFPTFAGGKKVNEWNNLPTFLLLRVDMCKCGVMI